MFCLNNSDTLEAGASVDAVVDCTVHGYVGAVFTNFYAGQLSDTNPTILYTAEAATSVVSVIMVNTHDSAVTVDLYLDPTNGGNPRRLIPKTLALGVGFSMHFDGQRCTVLNADGRILEGYGGHGEKHTNGTDDIQSANNARQGLATAAHIQAVEANTAVLPAAPIIGDGTVGMVLRHGGISIQNGTDLDTLKVHVNGVWNLEDILPQEDNLTRGGSTTSFALNAGGNLLEFKSSAIAGNFIACLSTNIISKGNSGVPLRVNSFVGNDQLRFVFLNAETGASRDMTDEVDSGTTEVRFTVLTSE